MNKPFRDRLLAEVDDEISRSLALHGGYNSHHEAYAVILEELDEYWEEVRKKTADRRPSDMKKELVQVAACAVKAVMCLIGEEVP